MISSTINIEKLREVIELYRLNKKSRKRENVYARAYFYHRMNGLGTLSSIGEMFNRDHATVINGLKIFEWCKDTPEMKEVIQYFTPIFDNCLNAELQYEFHAEDICKAEVYSLVNLENLISDRL